jgi:arsenite methyltransferase
MSMTNESAQYFAKQAGNWDQLRAGYFKETLREAAIARAYLRPEMVVADVGAGTGFMSAGLAPLVSRVYVLDGSAEMLDVARRNLGSLSNVTFQQADGAALPLQDGSIDAVFANMYLHHTPDPLVAIKEMVRLLKPGGRLVITDMDKHDNEWMRQEMADRWLGFDRGQMRAWWREAGLVNVLVDSPDQSCSATSQVTPSASVTISVFVATGSKRVSGAREAVQESYGAVAKSGGCGCSGASSTAQSCCSSSNAMAEVKMADSKEMLVFNTGYSDEQLSQVPAEAAAFSLGCGNPTAMASLKPGEVVLDIGSGAGIDSFYAARRVGLTGKVIGLDMTPSMIERAQRSAQAAGLSQVDFRLGQAEAMPVDSQTVDVVLSNCVINLCEDKGKVFEEAYRVLKPGGRLSISDMVTEGVLPMSVRSDPALWPGCAYGALPEQEYLDLVKGAGFTAIVAAHSMRSGAVEGVPLYSLAVSARKQGGQESAGGGCCSSTAASAPTTASSRCCGG